MLFRGGIRTRELPGSSDLEMDLDDDTNMSDDQTRSAHSAGTVDSDASVSWRSWKVQSRRCFISTAWRLRPAHTGCTRTRWRKADWTGRRLCGLAPLIGVMPSTLFHEALLLQEDC